MKINALASLAGLDRRLGAIAICSVLAACHSAAADRMAAARQALLATGEYQIEAQDAERGLLTVRSKRDGSLQLIDVNKDGSQPVANNAAATARAAQLDSTAGAIRSAPTQEAAASSLATGSSQATAAGAVATTSATSEGADQAGHATGTFAEVTAAERSTTALDATDANGRAIVLAHGPRIHIERSAGPAAAAAPAVANKPVITTGVSFNHAVICRSGDRMRLQQVRVDSPSAGIVLQSGCQLELIDSDVRSGDVALVVEAGATLRVENSTISGRIGSLQASNTTRVSSWASDFTGPTLLEGAEFIDRGGNTWQ